MLDGVVEDPRLPLDPFARLVADTERAPFRDDERQVADEAGVDEAVVRGDVRAGTQHRKEDGGHAPRHARKRYAGERRKGARAPLGIAGHGRAVLPEVERAPVGIVGHAGLRVPRTRRIALHIRLQRAGIAHHGEHLLANDGRGGFDGGQPWERGAVVELDLRQARKEVVLRLLEVRLAQAQEDVERFAKARCRRAVQAFGREPLT